MPKKKSNSPVAGLISRVFDPVIEIPIALSLAVFWAIDNGFRWRFLVLLLLIDALLPFMFFVHQLKKGEVSNWDIRDRRERIPLYFFTMIVHLIGVLAAFVLGKYALFQTLLIFYSVAIVFMIVTFFWKISIHAGINALLVTFVNYMLDWKYWWLYLLVLLVGWARVRDGHHRWSQVLAGALLAGGMVYVGLSLATG